MWQLYPTSQHGPQNVKAHNRTIQKKNEKMSNTDPPINWGLTQVHRNGK